MKLKQGTIITAIFLLFVMILLLTASHHTGKQSPFHMKSIAVSDESILAQKQIPIYPINIMARYPHRENIFTQGIVLDGDVLYESGGLYGRSTLTKIQLSTDTILKEFRLHKQFFGEDITLMNKDLIQLTYRSGLGFVYDKASLQIKNTFTLSNEGWGLTHNDQYLILSDGSDKLVFLDPKTYTQQKILSVTANGIPVKRLNALQYIDGYVYANVWQTAFIAKIALVDGRVVAWVDCRDLIREPGNKGVLNGIAWDPVARHLFLTGKNWANLYAVTINT